MELDGTLSWHEEGVVDEWMDIGWVNCESRGRLLAEVLDDVESDLVS